MLLDEKTNDWTLPVYRTTTLNGMTIPKGTQVIPLIHAVHMDPTLWKDPELFNPDRFLSADGTKIVKPDYFIPFGVGRRVCLGDVLAKAELFLFFSSLLHVFNLQVPQGAAQPDLRGQAGVTVAPQSFQVKHFSPLCLFFFFDILGEKRTSIIISFVLFL